MTVSVKDLLNLYRFPSGRRVSCLRTMRDHLVGRGFVDLEQELDEAIAAEWETRDLEMHYHAGQASKGEYSPEAMEIDAELDRTLGAIDDACALTLKAYGEESARGQAATQVREALFPHGVRYLVHMPYREQEAEVVVLLKRIEASPELAEAIRELGVEDLVAMVAEINLRYDAAIRSGPPAEPVSYPEVRAARVAGHERLCWIVIQVTARLGRVTPESEQAEALTAAVAEVLGQNALIKRVRKRRRGVSDVDPEEAAEELDGEDAVELPALPMREPPAGEASEAA